MNELDVIIVGAGPAGAGAAIELASRGARVLIAEQKRFPREKLCGEFISPECLEHFERLGVLHSPIVDRPYGSVLTFKDPDGIQFEMFHRDGHP